MDASTSRTSCPILKWIGYRSERGCSFLTWAGAGLADPVQFAELKFPYQASRLAILTRNSGLERSLGSIS